MTLSVREHVRVLVRTQQKCSAFAYGYAAGFGVDICVWNNLFVRGEYEYMQFGAFKDVNMHVHTARVGHLEPWVTFSIGAGPRVPIRAWGSAVELAADHSSP